MGFWICFLGGFCWSTSYFILCFGLGLFVFGLFGGFCSFLGVVGLVFLVVVFCGFDVLEVGVELVDAFGVV